MSYFTAPIKIFCNLISEVNIDMFGVRSPHQLLITNLPSWLEKILRDWIIKIYWLNYCSPKETGSRGSKFLYFSKIHIINLYNKYVQINSRDIVVFGLETNCSDHRVFRVTFHYCIGEKLYTLLELVLHASHYICVKHSCCDLLYMYMHKL